MRAEKQIVKPHFKGKRQHVDMIYFKMRDMLPINKTAFFNLVSLGLMLGVFAQGASAQETGRKLSVKESAKAMAALEKRVKSLEAQITDLRTMIGTISSLRQSPDNRAAGLGDGSRSRSMIDAAPLNNSRRVNNSRPMVGPSLAPPVAPRFGAPAPHLTGRGPDGVALPAQRPDLREDGFDSRRATPRDRQASLPETGVAPARGAEPANTQDAQKLYNDAYGYMLRRDYASAEKAFNALVQNHPQSRMAGNAQYWLGETYFVRGKYRPAADAFLKAYRNYSNGVKAPDSLMKLALSLTKLGQTGAACKTFSELASKYPNAPNHVKQRAGMEQRRAHCN